MKSRHAGVPAAGAAARGDTMVDMPDTDPTQGERQISEDDLTQVRAALLRAEGMTNEERRAAAGFHASVLQLRKGLDAHCAPAAGHGPSDRHILAAYLAADAAERDAQRAGAFVTDGPGYKAFLLLRADVHERMVEYAKRMLVESKGALAAKIDTRHRAIVAAMREEYARRLKAMQRWLAKPGGKPPPSGVSTDIRRHVMARLQVKKTDLDGAWDSHLIPKRSRLLGRAQGDGHEAEPDWIVGPEDAERMHSTQLVFAAEACAQLVQTEQERRRLAGRRKPQTLEFQKKRKNSE